ncbi:MAG TPA: (d)CMP kinase [Candidatus Limnocylindrales bacterium]|jgi:cytidylate kinase|nr:(d)CMP kinase [Candidatus Limnocylindrales bacterium]
MADESRLVVALDGPASSGKSSVGAAAALELGYRFMDTGLLYRALTWLARLRGIEPGDVEELVGLVGEVELAQDEQGRLARVLVDGVDETDDVHTEEVDAQVSAYSRVPELRASLLERQRAIADGGRIIVAGRDIGTVVLPHADLKVFLNASAEERARRRAEERGIDPGGAEGKAILAELRRRDEIDSTRTVAPLRPADDARILVTDGNRFEQTVGMVTDAIRTAERERSPRSPEVKPSTTEPRPIESHVTPLIWGTAMGARFVARAFTRVRFGGAVDEIPREGPVIFAANHISNADPVVIGAWLTPRVGRRLHWLAKREIFDWPILGWAARHGGMHPVDRSGADVEAFRLAKRILDEGQPLFVFPEGTRSPDGRLQRAKDGVAMLALRTNAPIVPIGIADSDRVWPKGAKLPRPGGRVTVKVGRPFRLAELLPPGVGGREAKSLATTALMSRIAELLPARHRGVYGDTAS